MKQYYSTLKKSYAVLCGTLVLCISSCSSGGKTDYSNNSDIGSMIDRYEQLTKEINVKMVEYEAIEKRLDELEDEMSDAQVDRLADIENKANFI